MSAHRLLDNCYTPNPQTNMRLPLLHMSNRPTLISRRTQPVPHRLPIALPSPNRRHTHTYTYLLHVSMLLSAQWETKHSPSMDTLTSTAARNTGAQKADRIPTLVPQTALALLHGRRRARPSRTVTFAGSIFVISADRLTYSTPFFAPDQMPETCLLPVMSDFP